jgi:thiamine biosynthesis lipoprotein
VEIGGDLRAFGTRPDGSPWHVGITNPLEPKSIYYLVDLPPVGGPPDYALVTSGDYEQFYEVAGVRYTHIFEPKTGEPILYRGAGVSVAASDATTADALATAFFVVGRERSLTIAEKADVGVLWLESSPEKTLTVTINDQFRKLKPEQEAESK